MQNKKKFYCLICFFVQLIIVSCHFPFGMEPQWYGGDDMGLYTIAAFSVVGADERDVPPKITVLETDDYGRTLFSIRFKNPVFYSFYNNKTTEAMCAYAFIICQKIDDEKTYYYEDDCYQIYESTAAFTLSESNTLKTQNDWNKPLDEEKMTFRNIITPYDIKLNAMPLDYDINFNINLYKEELFWQLYPRFSKDRLFSNYLDCNMQGKSIIVIWLWPSPAESGTKVTEEPNSKRMAFFMMLEPDCLQTKKGSIKEIIDPDHYWRELKEFKKENDW